MGMLSVLSGRQGPEFEDGTAPEDYSYDGDGGAEGDGLYFSGSLTSTALNALFASPEYAEGLQRVGAARAHESLNGRAKKACTFLVGAMGLAATAIAIVAWSMASEQLGN